MIRLIRYIITISLITSILCYTNQTIIYYAEAEEFDPITKMNRTDDENPEFQEKEPAPFILPKPPLPGREKADNLSTLPRVLVSKFRFKGNTVFSDEELREITGNYEGKEITFEELQSLRHDLTIFYIENGYINSGVTIPDQKVTDGVITFKIIEGKLRKIEIEGNQKLRTGYIFDRLKTAEKGTLNINELQKSLQLLQQYQVIERVNAELKPGIMPGDGILDVKVKEKNPFNMWMEFSNRQSPSIGAYRGEVGFSHINVTGGGDTLTGAAGVTKGLFDIKLSYAYPLRADDTTIEFFFKKSESNVVEDPFDNLDIESRSDTYGITLSRPFYRSTGSELLLSVSGEYRRSESYLLDRAFSFAEGAENGKAKITVIRFSQDWINRTGKQVIALKSAFTVGINAFGATVHDDDEADGEFLTWLGQFQWVRRLDSGGSLLIFKTNAQLSNDTLLSLEKFSVGGMNSVRGYRENQLVRDNGVTTSLEFRIPVVHNRKQEEIVYLAPFGDMGWSWHTEADTPKPRYISSVGLGLRWKITPNIHFKIYGAKALRNMENADHDLQDEGFHFKLTGTLF